MSKSQKPPIVKPATLERGEARYFHGRVKILDDFKELLGRAKEGKSGTSILIQSAPGAGKTALLHECARIAEANNWTVSNLRAKNLWDIVSLGKSLGLMGKVKEGEIIWRKGHSNAVQRESRTTRLRPDPLDIIEMSKKPLLLLLDEAQRLYWRIPRLRDEQLDDASEFVKSIHNGEVGSPVILIAAGLGATSAAFDSLGISRFDPGCLINLEPLSEGASRAVIHDWLLEEGEAKGDPAPWIHAIVNETHGWPQHIMAYVWPALKQLKLTGGELTPEGLKTALEEGRKGRIEFYKARTRDFPREQLHCIARVIANAPSGASFAKMDIMASLRMDYNHDTAEKIFTLALHKGILNVRDNLYVVPIPSMHNWLVDNFARYRAPLFPPPQPPDLSIEHAPKEQDQGLER